MRKEAERFADSAVMEGMVSIRAVIRAREAGINDRKIIKILFDREKAKDKARELAFLSAKAEKHGFLIERSDAAAIDEMTVGSSHGGIIALCTERTIPPVAAFPIKGSGFYVMLDGIEDPYNFGYCLRSLYAAGADGVLVGPRSWFSAAGVVCRSSAASDVYKRQDTRTAHSVQSRYSHARSWR